MVSHELRTPLNLISGLSDLLLRETQPEAAPNSNRQEDLERIYVNAQHLDGLIRDVLDLTRIEVGQLQLSYEAVDIHEMLEPVIVIARQLTRDKSLQWCADIPDELPRVWGDRTRLRQVVLNLINNAVKFTTQGEVSLRVTTGNKDADAGASNDAGASEVLTVSVSDTGLGISPEEQILIFDEFRQSERTTARGYGGLGLGLAICKLLVEMHQGTISVHSTGEEGCGAEFYFTLPVIEHDVAGAGDTLACDYVLLLTEDPTQGQRLEEHLAHKGVDIVMHAVNTDTDWRALLCGGSPDAVILDQAVTAAHGWNILRTLKEYPHTRDVPVLCYTLSGDGDKGALLPFDFVMKPLGKTQLAEMLLGQGLLDTQGDAPETRKILIVDDDPNILAMHTRMVQAQSSDASQYQVLQAHNGREALDILHHERPDLVLLDLMMPELDGFGVLEAMRENPATQRIPVVILTAQVLTENDMARLNRGMISILSKGLFSAEETLQHIETMLARRRKTVLEVQRLVHKAMAYIHTNYMQSLTRGEIASHVGLSERHLTRCFQQEMGVTPITYLNRYRIQQAKILLEAGNMAITEVAMAVGFSSGGYFTRVFRQEMGVSPREYQSGDTRNACEGFTKQP